MWGPFSTILRSSESYMDFSYHTKRRKYHFSLGVCPPPFPPPLPTTESAFHHFLLLLLLLLLTPKSTQCHDAFYFPTFSPAPRKVPEGHSVSKYGKTISSVQYFCRSAELFLCVFCPGNIILRLSRYLSASRIDFSSFRDTLVCASSVSYLTFVLNNFEVLCHTSFFLFCMHLLSKSNFLNNLLSPPSY